MLFTKVAWGQPFELAGWYNDGWDDESHAVYLKHHHLFTEVNPYWYNLGIDDGGSGAMVAAGKIHERAYVYSASKVQQIKAHHDLVIPTVGDNAPQQLLAILDEAPSQQSFIQQLVSIAQKRNYDGWDLNFEHGVADHQAAFTRLVQTLADALHATSKTLTVTLRPAANTREENRGIFDYAALGRTDVDRFKVMMYDHHFEHDPDVPGPIADYVWIEACLKYMLSRGLPPSKTQLALHNYGWLWQRQSRGFVLQFPHTTFAVLAPLLGPLQWDVTAQESWGEFRLEGHSYRAYVGDARTVSARLPLIQKYHLVGVAFWVLGREDPNIYPVLERIVK